MKKDLTTLNHRGIYTIRSNGRVTHKMGAFEPEEGDTHNFAQCYLLDPLSAVETRLQHQSVVAGHAVNSLDRGVMTALTDHINEHNKYNGMYDTAQQRFAESPDATHLRIRQVPGGPDPRRYNLPTHETTDIAAVILNDQDPIHDGRDLWLKRKIPRGANGELELHRVSELHSSYLALHYPLLHPNGEDGWHTGIPLKGAAWDPEQYPLWAVRDGDEGDGDQAGRPQQRDPDDGQQPRRQQGEAPGGARRLRPNQDGGSEEDEEDDSEGDEDADADPEARDRKTKTVTALEWIRYHLHRR